jgi:KDO2-lipid IV(A) lauroyltransferase
MGAPLRSLRHGLLYTSLAGLFIIGKRLPLRLLQALGVGVGAAACVLSRRDLGRAREHVLRAFPELDATRRDRLVRRCARHLGRTLGEVVWLAGASAEQVASVCSLSGVEHLRDALSRGRGAVLVTGHCGNWELLNARLGVAEVPMTIAVRAVDHRGIDQLATVLRSRHGAEVVPRGPTAGRKLARALIGGRVAGLLIDQDLRDAPGVFVPFFGHPTWTPSGAATLALRLSCPVVPAFVHRLPGGRHRAEVHPPLQLPEHGDLGDRVVEVTAAATRAIEDQVRAHPEQWVWMHRRWRTRPEGVHAVTA